MDLKGYWVKFRSYPVVPVRDTSSIFPSECQLPSSGRAKRYRREIEERSRKYVARSAYRVKPKIPLPPRGTPSPTPPEALREWQLRDIPIWASKGTTLPLVGTRSLYEADDFNPTRDTRKMYEADDFNPTRDPRPATSACDRQEACSMFNWPVPVEVPAPGKLTPALQEPPNSEDQLQFGPFLQQLFQDDQDAQEGIEENVVRVPPRPRSADVAESESESARIGHRSSTSGIQLPALTPAFSRTAHEDVQTGEEQPEKPEAKPLAADAGHDDFSNKLERILSRADGTADDFSKALEEVLGTAEAVNNVSAATSYVAGLSARCAGQGKLETREEEKSGVEAELEKVRAGIKEAVGEEDFERAMELQKREEALSSGIGLEAELDRVRAEKRRASNREDFEKAMVYKSLEEELLTKMSLQAKQHEATEGSSSGFASIRDEADAEENCGEVMEPEKTEDPEVSTTHLLEEAPAGSTILQVADATGFAVGDLILIESSAGSEENLIEGFSSIVIGRPLKYTHQAGTAIKQVPRALREAASESRSAEASSLCQEVSPWTAEDLSGVACYVAGLGIRCTAEPNTPRVFEESCEMPGDETEERDEEVLEKLIGDTKPRHVETGPFHVESEEHAAVAAVVAADLASSLLACTKTVMSEYDASLARARIEKHAGAYIQARVVQTVGRLEVREKSDKIRKETRSRPRSASPSPGARIAHCPKTEGLRDGLRDRIASRIAEQRISTSSSSSSELGPAKAAAEPLEQVEASSAVAVGTVCQADTTTAMPAPEVCHEVTKAVCKKGHPLITLSPSDDGWCCDGRFEPGGCRSGMTDFFQSSGMIRHECRQCNYDLCERCYYSIFFGEAAQKTPVHSSSAAVATKEPALQASVHSSSSAVPPQEPAREMSEHSPSTAVPPKAADVIFEIEVDKRRGAPIGLDVDHRVAQSIKVTQIKSGLISDWNVEHPDLKVAAGDYITEINGVSGDVRKLLVVVGQASKLKMTIQRVGKEKEPGSLVAPMLAPQSQSRELPVPEAPASAPNELGPGVEVRVVGLKARPEFNGLCGTIKRWDESTGRWDVRMEDGSGKMLKSVNLVIVSATAGEAADHNMAANLKIETAPAELTEAKSEPQEGGDEKRSNASSRSGVAEKATSVMTKCRRFWGGLAFR